MGQKVDLIILAFIRVGKGGTNGSSSSSNKKIPSNGRCVHRLPCSHGYDKVIIDHVQLEERRWELEGEMNWKMEKLKIS